MSAANGNGVKFVKHVMKYIVEGGGFDRIIEKVKIVAAGEGRCMAEMVVGSEHQNRGGTLHGGCTATLVDCISTFALMTHGKGSPGVSVNMSINYLKPALEGEEIVIDANTLRAGKKMAYLSVDIKKKISGELVATASHIKFIG